MKECIGALAATAALLIASVAFARQEKSVPYKYQGGAPVYADLAKAPEKARAKRNPFEKDPEAVDAGRNLFEQPNATATPETAQGRLLVFAPKKFRAPHRELFSGL